MLWYRTLYRNFWAFMDIYPRCALKWHKYYVTARGEETDEAFREAFRFVPRGTHRYGSRVRPQMGAISTLAHLILGCDLRSHWSQPDHWAAAHGHRG